MKPSFPALSAVSLALLLAACDGARDASAGVDAGTDTGSDDATALPADAGTDAVDPPPDAQGLSAETVLDLNDVKTNPGPYDWFDFKPNVKKLILAGVPETEHVAILWYTITEGAVGLHYHAKTESVFVVDGTQTDAKGVYPTGTVYFNPPGSGHEIMHSSGFFLLAYAAPPDFANTSLIGEYTPIRIDTSAADLTTAYPFVESEAGVRVFSPALDSTGGMTAAFIDITSLGSYVYSGNYLLVLKGSCDVEGVTIAKDKLVVGKAVTPRSYKIAASTGSTCLVMGVSF
jgi:hypothetical protein